MSLSCSQTSRKVLFFTLHKVTSTFTFSRRGHLNVVGMMWYVDTELVIDRCVQACLVNACSNEDMYIL